MGTTTIKTLNHNTYKKEVVDYLDAKAAKKITDAESRRLDAKIKNLRSALFLAMEGANVARCGNAVITIKPEKVNPGMLTLKDGRKIPLDDIDEIWFAGGKDVVKPSDVKTWYGGAVNGADLEVTITGEAV